jgi:hypothetical protein
VIAATTANVYFITRWAKDGGGVSLLAAGATLTLATLAHFDTWVLAPIELAVVIAFAQRRWGSRERTEATTLLWLLAGGYGIALFLVMNVMIFGDPLAFLHGYTEQDGGGSAATAAAAAVGESRSSSRVGFAYLVDYPQAAFWNAGPALAVLGGIGLVGAIARRRRDRGNMVALLLLYPLGWYSFQALTTGSFIVPGPDMAGWINLRYGVTLLPAFAYFAAVGLPRRAGALAGVVVAIAAGGLMVADHRVASWEDAVHDMPASRATLAPLSDWLTARADADDQVFLPVHHRLNDRFEFQTRLSLSTFVDSNDRVQYRALRRHPERARSAGVRWIVWLGEQGAPVVDRVLRASGAVPCYDVAGDQAELARVRIYSVAPACTR